MKKKIICALIALILCLACVPLFSACSPKTDYILKEDADGNRYYSANISGFKDSLEGEYVIPETYGEENLPVKEIEQEGFASTNISKIVIPKTITKIGNAAFAYCGNLKEVVFADGIQLDEISRGAFGYCKGLIKINIPETVKSLGILAFTDCYNLDGVILPEGLESIGVKCFYFSGINNIVVPDSVTEIGLAAFHSCSKLTSAVVGSGVKTLKSGVFGYCPALERVYLSSNLQKIEGAHYTDGSEERSFADGEFYCGHAFHHNEALKDVYYSGTSAQWAALLSGGMDNEPVTESGVDFDNSALANALLHYGAEYNN